MRVTSKGQVTIPESIRLQFGIYSGSEVDFLVENNKIYLKVNVHPSNIARFAKLKGTATSGFSTREIMSLTRGG